MKYAVVIDSTTKLRKEFAKEILDKIDVRVVPVRVYINQQEYNDSDELTSTIIEAIKNNEKVETSLPSVKIVENLFEELSEKYEKVYVLSVSSLLSGTYNLFSTIASKYENILVFDSKSVSIQNSYIFERMVTDILSGKEIKEDDIISYRDDSLFLISVFDIKQLHKSGRVGKILSLLGRLMHIKPILTIARTGEVELVGKALSSSKVLEILDKSILNFIAKEFSKIDDKLDFSNFDELNSAQKIAEKIGEKFLIFAATGSDEYKDFIYKISMSYGVKPTFLDIGPAVTVHAGLQGFGILVGKRP